ncbi:ead/Ea22-like family protein [Klebsiella pneumoniae]
MTDITELAQILKAAAEKASDGDWVKESGDGWEAACSANDQANGGFIIAHFEGPDAAENREFVQAANPANILALVEVLEKAQTKADVYDMLRDDYGLREKGVGLADFVDWQAKRIAALESRTVKLPDLRQIVSGDRYVWSDGVYNYSQDVKVVLAAAGIKVEAE